VDFSGLPCDLREIRALADRYGFRILEDASHAAGASYLGHPVGSDYADASVFSFHAVKIVTTAEGGMVTTQDQSLARKLQLLRSHGMTREAGEMTGSPEGAWYYEQHLLGFNYRLTDVQAALGSSQLRRMDALHQARCALADRYDALLQDLPLRLPPRLPDRVSSWHLYAVEVLPEAGRTRAEVFRSMRDAKIGVNVHYIPVHLQPYYKGLGFQAGDFPAAEAYYRGAISLPLFPALTDAQQFRVAETLRAALGLKG
jgi:dTDP-4-amino-4,6-dideoxygalactose transaminase